MPTRRLLPRVVRPALDHPSDRGKRPARRSEAECGAHSFVVVRSRDLQTAGHTASRRAPARARTHPTCPRTPLPRHGRDAETPRMVDPGTDAGDAAPDPAAPAAP